MNKYILCAAMVLCLGVESQLHCKKQKIKPPVLKEEPLPQKVRDNPVWWCSVCKIWMDCGVSFCSGCFFPQVSAYHEDQYGRGYTGPRYISESEKEYEKQLDEYNSWNERKQGGQGVDKPDFRDAEDYNRQFER